MRYTIINYEIKVAKAKTEEFTKWEIELAAIAKALAHPARIKILSLLNRKNVCITGELVDLLPLAQSTVSQHLKELQSIGLIKGEVEGPKMCYCIEPKMMKKVKSAFNNLFSKINCC